jgi:signal transduction histidine kinase
MENSDAYNEISIIVAEKQKIIDQLTFENNSLLKTISHDIRGPFNQIFALLQLMELEMPDTMEKSRDYIDRMYQSVISGMELVKNLQELRNIDQGKVSIHKEETDLAMLINKSINSFRIPGRIKKISIDFTSPDVPVNIFTDPVILKKSLECVLSNAIKYSPLGSKVTVQLSQLDDAVCLEVLDMGPGIIEKELSEIYKKFVKLSPSPTGGESSSGLGMYLANELLTYLGYGIKIENRTNGTGLSVRILIRN